MENTTQPFISACNQPFISVCTPTFNRRPFIPYMIKCFDNQDYPKDKMEWIIIDDGTDKIDDLVSDHPKVKYFSYDKKMPLGKKRNLMHEKCQGDIIVYMDDDDYYPSMRVSHAVEKLQANPLALCAGSSRIFVYYDHIDKIYQFGPYGEKHATAGTFAFRKELLKDRRYNDDACLAEEKDFLNNYTVPFVQLDPEKVILVFAHDHNTVNKKKLLENPDERFVILLDKTVEELVPEEELRRFYKDNLNTILKTYEPGLPHYKPDVIQNIIELKKTRRKEAENQANEKGQIIMKQPDGSVKKISPTEMVSIVQQQQVQYKNLQQQFGNIKNIIIEKDAEIKYLTEKLSESLSTNLAFQKLNVQLIHDLKGSSGNKSSTR